MVTLLLALLAVASNQTGTGILCSYFGIFCPATTTIPYTQTNNTNHSVTALKISTNGTVKLTSSSEGQYSYSITLPKSNATGIYSFALLGSYGNRNVYVRGSYANCTIYSEVVCRTTFVVGLGSYSMLGVSNNGNWLYAMKLPSNLTLIQAPIIEEHAGGFSFSNTELWMGIGAVLAISAVGIGNIYYYRKHKDELYGVS